jgi:hypothetical protein
MCVYAGFFNQILLLWSLSCMASYQRQTSAACASTNTTDQANSSALNVLHARYFCCLQEAAQDQPTG